MKRFFMILMCAISSVLLCAQSSSSEFYKQKIFEYINSAQYEQVVQIIDSVRNWSDSRQDTIPKLYASNIMSLIAYTDSIYGDENKKIDSLLVYLIEEYMQSGKDLYQKRKFNDAFPYFDIVCNLRKRLYGTQSPTYAAALNNVGMVYEAIENYKMAIEYYNQAINVYAISMREHPNYAAVLSRMGSLLFGLSKFSSASEYFIEAIKIYEKIADDRYVSVCANIYMKLGASSYYLGKYKEAQEYYITSLQYHKKGGNEISSACAKTLNNLAALYYAMGEYTLAEDNYLKAMSIRHQLYGEDHISYMECLQNLGLLYHDMGNNIMAQKYCEKVLQYYNSHDMTNSTSYFSLLNTLGLIAVDLEKYPEAIEYYSLAINKLKNDIEGHYYIYSALINNIAAPYIAMYDYSGAEKYYLISMEIREKYLGSSHPDYASSLSNLGFLYAKTGDKAKAEEFLLRALELRGKNLNEQHPEYILSLNNLGLLYLHYREYAKAEEYFKNAQNLLQERYVYVANSMTEKERELYWNTISKKFYSSYPRFSYYFHFQNPSSAIFAYKNELFIKGTLLISSESIKRSIYEGGDTLLVNKWKELTEVRRLIIELQEKKSKSYDITEYQERAEQLEKEITKSSAAYRENQAMWQITWDSVRNHISSNQVAIEYMVAPLNEDSTMYCALLLRDTCSYPIMIPLFNEPEVTSLVNTSTENQTSFTYSYDGNGEQLSQLVWSKIHPYIKKNETVYFAPSGLLHQLAIESLPYDENHTMADIFNLVRLSSTREIVTNKLKVQHSSATLYGGIQYDVDTDELLAESEKYSASDLLASRGIESDTLDRGSIKYLKGTKNEVETINSMLKQNNLQVQLFTSTNANEESFKALSGKHQNILHIATHGFFWTDSTAQKKEYFSQRMLTLDNNTPSPPVIDPLNRCGLLFAGAQTAWSGHSTDLPEGVQDGILTAKEISLLDLRDADLVVLSACETGKGEITGDGVFGLQRAFKQAGAQTIIMSLWPVNDVATQLLMSEFYRNWITEHQSKREAFRNAQNTVRSQYEEPVYWAGFIMLD